MYFFKKIFYLVIAIIFIGCSSVSNNTYLILKQSSLDTYIGEKVDSIIASCNDRAYWFEYFENISYQTMRTIVNDPNTILKREFQPFSFKKNIVAKQGSYIKDNKLFIFNLYANDNQVLFSTWTSVITRAKTGSSRMDSQSIYIVKNVSENVCKIEKWNDTRVPSSFDGVTWELIKNYKNKKAEIDKISPEPKYNIKLVKEQMNELNIKKNDFQNSSSTFALAGRTELTPDLAKNILIALKLSEKEKIRFFKEFLRAGRITSINEANTYAKILNFQGYISDKTILTLINDGKRYSKSCKQKIENKQEYENKGKHLVAIQKVLDKMNKDNKNIKSSTVKATNSILDDYINELNRLNRKFNSYKYSCSSKNSINSYSAGAQYQSCMRIKCTTILGLIKDKYYKNFRTKYQNCLNKKTSACKIYIKKYEESLLIDKTCGRKIISI